MSEPISSIKGNAPTFEEIASPERAPASPGFESAVSGNEGFSSVNDLKRKAPEAFKGILESMAREACRQAKKGADRIKAAMKEGQDRS